MIGGTDPILEKRLAAKIHNYFIRETLSEKQVERIKAMRRRKMSPEEIAECLGLRRYQVRMIIRALDDLR